MKNIDGALGFEATLDIDDFNVSADAMERHMKKVSTSVQNDGAEMEKSLLDFARKGAMYLQSYLVGMGLNSVLTSIVQVRGQFQQLEIAFGTMLGSEEKANALMQQMIDTAAKTPFDLAGVAGGAKQLLAYGESADKVNDTLVRLGNIASGLSIPLGDIVYLYGTTMVQGRLYAQDVRQFTGRGIPLVKELAAMYGVTAEEINAMVSAGKIGFPDVEKVINKLTDSGGQFFNLMERQSASLTGMISNLEDAWDGMLNEIGKQNQDVFSGAIGSASYLVEHYQDVANILKAVAVGYGSVKAAIVLNTLATKGYTGVALIDNTVSQAKIALMKAEAVLTGQSKAQTDAMTSARMAHVGALQAELSAEELTNLQKRLRIATISQLLTAQQQEYLSNVGLTASSEGYEAAAMQVLSVDQQLALKKTDLSARSAVYVSALEAEVAAKRNGSSSTLDSMRADVKAAAAKMEGAKQSAVAAMQATEAARYEVYWAKQSGDATRIAAAEKKLEGATENQAISRKAALSASTDFYTKKKELEAAATRLSSGATAADTAAKSAQTAATSILSAVTGKLTTAFKTLWATVAANPMGALLSVVGLVVSAFMLFKDKQEESNDAMGEFQETTRETIEKLDLYMSVLQNTEAGTKTHKDALEKVNAICKEYNKTLLEENSSLGDQKEKYDELTKAIQETTAEKIKSKYAERALTEAREKQKELLDELMERGENLSYNRSGGQGTYSSTTGLGYESAASEEARNIREMDRSVYDAISSMIQDNSRRLAQASGEEYDKAYNEVLGRIVSSVKDISGASDEELNAFSSLVGRYMDEYIATVRKADGEINKVTASMGVFFAPKDSSDVVESMDYVSMSFDDLSKRISDNMSRIDELNKMIIDPRTDPGQLDSLRGELGDCLSLMDELNGAVGKKTENLNTENGINERIKELKDERAAVEMNSEKYKDLTKQIDTLQDKLSANTRSSDSGSGRSNVNDRIKADEDARNKQLEADRKLEEARIDIMEDGYAKRKAMLDLNRRRNLDDIDKEERELEAARRRAGKAGLSDSERDDFSERRDIEEKRYSVESSKLFDAEIEYRKKEYSAYWQWVRNVGKDVADEHFKNLIADGDGFSSWVDAQIAVLESKKATSGVGFDDGDAYALDALRQQQDEIRGGKSAMDLFRDSMERSIGHAETLAEKLEAVAELKDRLANGDFHLNADETVAVSYSLDAESAKLEKEVEDKVLSGYRTYEEKRKSIQEEYSLLRMKVQKSGDSERLRMIDEAEAEELSSLNASMLKKSDSWKRLFEDLDGLSGTELAQLISDFQEQLDNVDLRLSPVDYKALMDSLDKAKEELVKKNPFAALNQFYDDYVEAKKRLAKAKANVAAGGGTDKDIKDAEGDVRKAAGNITKVIGEVEDAASGMGSSIKSALESFGMDDIADGLGSAVDVMGELGNAAGSVGKLISGDVMGGVTGLIGAASSLVSIFNGLHDKKYEKHIESLQDDIDELERSYNRLGRAFNNTYWVFTDEQRKSYEDNLELINAQIDAMEQEREVARRLGNYAEYAKLTSEITNLNEALSKASDGDDMFGLMEKQRRNLMEQQEKIREQIEAEKKKKKSDDKTIQSWTDAISDIGEEIDELDRTMMETLAGTDVQSAIDEFADALVDAFCKGEDAAEALGEKTKEVMKKAVVDALKRQYLAKGIDEAVKYLGDAMGDSVLSDAERATFTGMVDSAGDLFNNALAGLGDWIKDAEDEVSSDPLTGSVQGLSEETGGVIAGRLNAAILNQADQTAVMRTILEYVKIISSDALVPSGVSGTGGIDGMIGGMGRIYEAQVDQMSVMRAQLEYQAQIARNTGESAASLDEIRTSLRRMEQRYGNSLLSQGVV